MTRAELMRHALSQALRMLTKARILDLYVRLRRQVDSEKRPANETRGQWI